MSKDPMRDKRKEKLGDALLKQLDKHAVSGKEFIGQYLDSGSLLTGSIKETLLRMEAGQVQLIGPLPRRGDIGPVVARINEAVSPHMTVTQSRCYLFHPDSGKTVQMILVARVK